MKIEKKYKFKRRRAIECKFVEKSKTSPGYLKYEVTICEKDGTIHKKPAYGVDMQSAIARLVNQERTAIVEKKVINNSFIFFLIWMSIMALPVVIHGDITYTPWFILYMFASFTAMFLFAGWWQNYLDKK
jgi:hypothetical protein